MALLVKIRLRSSCAGHSSILDRTSLKGLNKIKDLILSLHRLCLCNKQIINLEETENKAASMQCDHGFHDKSLKSSGHYIQDANSPTGTRFADLQQKFPEPVPGEAVSNINHNKASTCAVE